MKSRTSCTSWSSFFPSPFVWDVLLALSSFQWTLTIYIACNPCLNTWPSQPDWKTSVQGSFPPLMCYHPQIYLYGYSAVISTTNKITKHVCISEFPLNLSPYNVKATLRLYDQDLSVNSSEKWHNIRRLLQYLNRHTHPGKSSRSLSKHSLPIFVAPMAKYKLFSFQLPKKMSQPPKAYLFQQRFVFFFFIFWKENFKICEILAEIQGWVLFLLERREDFTILPKYDRIREPVNSMRIGRRFNW